MDFSRSITEIVRQRFSCRVYPVKPIEQPVIEKLKDAAASCKTGPLDSKLRFEIMASAPTGENALKGTGTYGLIKNPQAFIAGTVSPLNRGLEDFGYAMEQMVLLATDLNLGSCWLGATFSQNNIAKKIGLQDGEIIPAVISLGYIEDLENARNHKGRKKIKAFNRIAWEQQFFSKTFNNPISVEEAGKYTNPLEMVRLGPSASNKQPWRIVKLDNAWHFFLERTKGYGNGLLFKLLKVADIQRIDMGIAMCHFELTARQQGLMGKWKIQEPSVNMPERTEYIVSWVEA